MDAFLGETDDRGRMVSFDRVALVAVVGNEDGAHHVSAELYQALNDVGFTLPANAVTYWVGEAMGSTDYKDLGRERREGHQRHHHGSLQRRPPRPAPARSRLPAGLIGRSALRARARPRPSPVETAGSDDHGTNLVSRCSTVGQPWRLVHRRLLSRVIVAGPCPATLTPNSSNSSSRPPCSPPQRCRCSTPATTTSGDGGAEINRLVTNGVARSSDCAARPQAGTGRKASRNCWLRPWLEAQMSSGAWNSRA